MNDHRHFPPGIPEHDSEPVLGLPESLPKGETILWQGQPNWRQVALRIVHIRSVVFYFGLLLALQGYAAWTESQSTAHVLISLAKALPFALLALGGFVYLAWCVGKNAMYTITNQRIVMRIGIALTITYNIPFSRIVSADFLKRADGSGDITLRLKSDDKIAWLNLWPHARPWHLIHPQPSFRCLDQVESVAKILTQAWQVDQSSAQYSLGQGQSNVVWRPQDDAASMNTFDPSPIH